MANFTPGPWVVTDHGNIRQAESNEGHRLFVATSIEIPFNFGGNRTTEANLNLIAAAPEMYEALQKCLAWHVDTVNSGDCGCWDPETDEAVIAARAALAKADGKADAQ